MSDTYYKALLNTVRAPYLGAQVAWKTPGTRQPTRAEQPLVGFYQYQIQRLLDALQDEKPDLVRSERLARAYPRAVVAVGGPAFKQTRMFTGLPGSPSEPVMVLNLQEPVPLTLMRLARELPAVLGSPDQFLENWFLLYGRRSLGWRVSGTQDLPLRAQKGGLKPLLAQTRTIKAPVKLAAPPPVVARVPARKVKSQVVLQPAMMSTSSYGMTNTSASINFSGGLLDSMTTPAVAPAIAPTTFSPAITAPTAYVPSPTAYVPSPTASSPACDKDMYGQAMVWNPSKKPKPGCERVLKKLPANYTPPRAPVLRTKRGLGTTNVRALASMFPALSWYYNWNPTPIMNDQRLVPFVAMKAQQYWPSFEMLDVSSDPHALLYNEPNHKEQANLTPQAAAAQWAQAEDFLYWNPKVRLGSPCPANDGNKHMLGGDPFKWMDEYIRLLPPGAWNKIAFVTIHPYGNFSQLKNMVDTTWKKYKKPIWVTEFAAIGGLAAQTQLMREALPYLDSNPHVERYAWFPAGGFAWMSGGEKNPNILTTVEGELTPLGRMYMAGSPQTPNVKAAVKTARARAAGDVAAQQAAKAAKADTAQAQAQAQAQAAAAQAAQAQAAQAQAQAAQAQAAAAQAAQAQAAAAQAAAAAKAAKAKVTSFAGDESTSGLGTVTAAQLRPVRRMRVYLGLSFIPDAQIDDFAEGKGWEFVAKNIDGLWLNTANSGLKTTKGKTWLGEAVSRTSGDVVLVQNIAGADNKALHGGANPKGFAEWKASGQERYEGDGWGRSAGTGPIASNNALLNLRKIVQAGYNARVVGASVVTDYICGHNCLPYEDWDVSDMEVARAGLAAGLPNPKDGVPGIAPPLFPSTRNSWWWTPKRKYIDPKIRNILDTSVGLVYESAPVNFVDAPLAKRRNLLEGFKVAHKYASDNNKPLIWLAPRGTASDYLDTMKRAMALFEENSCRPDGVVVINYAPGENAPFPTIPDNRDGAPVNTTTGVARFLIEKYALRKSGSGL